MHLQPGDMVIYDSRVLHRNLENVETYSHRAFLEFGTYEETPTPGILPYYRARHSGDLLELLGTLYALV